MFDIGWSELLVIGALALIVVGPKDLPGMLRNLGRYMGKARSMAREFQRSMEDAAREADLSELTDVQKSMRDFNRKIGLDGPGKHAGKMNKPTAKPKAEPGAAPPAAKPEAAAPAPEAAPTEPPKAAPAKAPEAAPAKARKVAKAGDAPAGEG